MADKSMAFLEWLGQQGGEDFGGPSERVLDQLMEFEVSNQIQAGRHERTEGRQTYRNGHRERPLHTRLGTLELKVPKLRQGTYFSSFLEPRRLTERSLTAVIPGGLDRPAVDPQGRRSGVRP